MVNVSQRFMELAQESGRRVFCKINVGAEEFLDDRIIEFDFDDVVYPDWLTVGTTCANRFAFCVRYGGEFAVKTEVRPFISFDGEEWCPLGVFFVAKRYVRGRYASIVCYDKMYSLDKDYKSSYSAPTDTETLLREICGDCGIECEDFGFAYEVTEIPTGCTARDMIGYIAGINRGCASFDREGKLRIKKYTGDLDFYLQPENCFGYRRNMSPSRITRLVADTGTQTLESGTGGELASLELYNPLLTQHRLDNMVLQFAPMEFYGAEIEMQGMPFLEAGEYIYFEEKPAILLPLAIAEIEYHYDGALTATLYSRNRSYTDAVVHRDDLEAALEEIRASMGNISLKYVNPEALEINGEYQTAAEFEFDVRKSGSYVQADVNFTVNGGGSNTLDIAVFLNGTKLRSAVHAVNSNSKELIHFYHLCENLQKGKNKVIIKIKTQSGQMTIESGKLLATLVGKGKAGGEEVRDRLSASERLGALDVGRGGLAPAGIIEELEI